MNELELFAELIDDLTKDLRPVIEPLTVEELKWQPGEQANSIGVTLWHIGRGLDVLRMHILQNEPAENELWHSMGWCDRLGYDPRGVGYAGLGMLTGYTWEEVQAIPAMSAADLLAYLDQTCAAASAQLRNMGSDTAKQPVPWLMEGKLSYFDWIKLLYKDFQSHCGEILAIKSLMARSAI